jgi:mannonate dehydratase
MTFCTGSLGARPDNDLPAMFERFADKVHFLHLRNVKRDSDDIMGSFYEAEHLAGDTDMVAVIAAVVREERRRKAAGRKDHTIPMRPDHGQDILDDLARRSQPGYPTIGRMKGLAELRGVMTALEHAKMGL